MRSPLEGFCCSSSSCWDFFPLPLDLCCLGEGKEEEKTDEEWEEELEEVKEEGLDSTRFVQVILMATDFERLTFAAKYFGA